MRKLLFIFCNFYFHCSTQNISSHCNCGSPNTLTSIQFHSFSLSLLFHLINIFERPLWQLLKADSSLTQALLLWSLQGEKGIKQIIKTEFNATKKTFISLLDLTHISQGAENLWILLDGPHRFISSFTPVTCLAHECKMASIHFHQQEKKIPIHVMSEVF